MNSETPLTDKAWGAFDGNPHRAVDVHFARRLELRCKRLEEANVVLRRALNRYAKHDRDCPGHYGPCNCGLTEALTPPTTI